MRICNKYVTEVLTAFPTMYHLTSSIQFPKAMKTNEHTMMAAIAPVLSPLGPPPPEPTQDRKKYCILYNIRHHGSAVYVQMVVVVCIRNTMENQH